MESELINVNEFRDWVKVKDEEARDYFKSDRDIITKATSMGYRGALQEVLCYIEKYKFKEQ